MRPHHTLADEVLALKQLVQGCLEVLLVLNVLIVVREQEVLADRGYLQYIVSGNDVAVVEQFDDVLHALDYDYLGQFVLEYDEDQLPSLQVLVPQHAV